MQHVQDAPTTPWSEIDRLAALDGYHVLGTSPEAAFDDLARVAAVVCGTPAAAVSFVAEDRLCFKAAVGFDLREAPRQGSFCELALNGATPVVVPDALADRRFAGGPLVAGGPFVRFYAGVPLITAEGLPLGTLCVLDAAPHPDGLDARQIFALVALARQVMALLELRRTREARARSEERLTLTADIAGAVGGWTWDGAADRVYADPVFAEMFGLSRSATSQGVPTQAVIAAIHPADRHRIRAALSVVAARAGDFAEECRVVLPDGQVRWVFARAHCFHEAGRPARYPGVAIDVSERKAAAERLRLREETAQLALDAGHIGTFDYVPSTGALVWDARCKELFGLPADAPVDYATFLAGLHPDDREATDIAVRDTLDSAGGGEFDIEYRTIGLADGGVERWIAARGRTYRQEDGVTRFIGTVRDVTQRRRAEEQLRTAEASVRVALAAAQLGRFDHDPSTGRRFWDDRCREIFGVADEFDVSFEAVVAAIHPDDRDRVLAAVAAATGPGGGRLEVSYRIARLSDGEERWIAASGAAMFRGGVCVRFLGVVADVTAAKRQEEHLRLLVNELNHRVKNSFAMVQALATQSFREIALPQAAMQAFSGRLVALARAHDALTRRNWEGADMREVLESTLAVHGAGGAGRFEISGPRVRLSAKHALSVSMALHELSTNALKYGALSDPRGRVAVSWQVDTASRPARLRLRWEETGGPPVAPPTRRGFGSRLLERGLAAELGGEVVVAYEPEGVVCTMNVPLVETRAEPE